ncbi:LuxR C-terminal-related transcriptional regulator [Sinomonas sp. ASV322]|uniref:helix-turn-helix transcriptional regulator n=1 Tax=Sinomonas sp. ASV322 TaxID=3041920 RepID=UPI0027DE0560|nr:LuxR C-terminal-related transcriptional regulator [Sinomonas sp. ASV322]MDQ4502437.1 LuxR C-terminal-related transcriptional regulator [Sinomonas sp. ASV322]
MGRHVVHRAVPHPGLSVGDQPAEVLRVAADRSSAFVVGLGVQGTGKSEWGRQLIAGVRRRAVWVAADPYEADVPFSFADRLARAAGSPPRPLQSASADETTAAALDVLERLMARSGRRAQVCLVVDNLQWVDDASVRFARFVLSRLAYAPSIVLVLGRPAASATAALLQGADPSAWGLVRDIAFEPLTTQQVRTFISRTHGWDVSLRLAERIREQSGGLLSLIDAGVEAPVPTPGQLWDAHVDVFGPAAAPLVWPAAAPAAVRHVVEICSALGSATPPSEVEAIAASLGLAVDVDAALLSGLLVAAGDGVAVCHGVLARQATASMDRGAVSAILAAAAEQADDEFRRLELRLATADRLEPSLLDEVRARAASAPAHRTEQLLRCLRHAAELCVGPDREELLLEAGVLAVARYETQLVLDLVPALRAMPGSPVRDLVLANALQISGAAAEAKEILGLILLQPMDHPDAALVGVESALLAAVAHMVGDDGPPPRGLLDRARQLVDEFPDRAPSDARLLPLFRPHDLRLRLAALFLVDAGRRGSAEEVTASLGTLLALVESAPPSPGLVDALTCLAGVHLRRGEIARAARGLEQALSVASDVGGGWSLGQARCLLVFAYWILGRYEDARSQLTTATHMMLDTMDVSVRPHTHALEALLAATGGDAEAAAAGLAALDSAKIPEYGGGGPVFELVARAEAARTGGNYGGVLEVLTPAALTAAGLGGHGVVAYRIEALAALGHAEAADRELAAFRDGVEPGQALPFGDLDWLEGRVHEAYGFHDEARRSFHRAARRTEFPLPAARAREALGRVQIASGSRTAGLRNLKAARDAFRELNADPYWQNTLLTLGEPPLAGDARLAGLSAREREVHLLAAAGRTNREIADELSISAATAAFHMRNVLAKTGAKSRRELR